MREPSGGSAGRRPARRHLDETRTLLDLYLAESV